jgi:hypothetical protein
MLANRDWISLSNTLSNHANELAVAGSGDVAASERVAKSAKLSVACSADIDDYASNSLKARVAGSGDIRFKK